MTIKQQGGIFGRNPSFNDVEANEINIGDGASGGSINISKDESDGFTAIVLRNDSTASNTLKYSGITFRGTDTIGTNKPSAFIRSYPEDGNYVNASLSFSIRSGDVTAEKARFTSAGNLKFINAGNGIDFSATSGTGTSELFSDYEEGVFTPTLTTSGTDFSSVTYDAAVFGSYTKVGNVVHIQLLMQTDAVTKGSASGNVIIGGLPFTADGTSPLAVATSKDWLSNYPTRAYVADGATTISLLTNANNTADDENVVVADVKTLANDNTLRLSGTYRAS